MSTGGRRGWLRTLSFEECAEEARVTLGSEAQGRQRGRVCSNLPGAGGLGLGAGLLAKHLGWGGLLSWEHTADQQIVLEPLLGAGLPR